MANMIVSTVSPEQRYTLMLASVARQLGKDNSREARGLREALQRQDLVVKNSEESQQVVYDLRRLINVTGTDDQLQACLTGAADNLLRLIGVTTIPANVGMQAGQILKIIFDDKIILSVKGLRPHFVGGGFKCMKQLRVYLEASEIPTEANAIQAHARSSATLTIGKHQFTLYKEIRSSMNCWAIASTDKARLGQAMTWIEASDIPSVGNKIAISENVLKAYFVGTASVLVEEVRVHIRASGLPTEINAIRRHEGASATFRIGLEEFSVYKAHRANKCCWALDTGDLDRLGQAMGWKRLSPIPKLGNKIPLSVNGLGDNFVGSGGEHMKTVRQHLTAAGIPFKSAQVRRHSGLSAFLRIGDQDFTLHKALQAKSNCCWALDPADKTRFANAVGWIESSHIPEMGDHISLTGSGLNQHYVGTESDLSAALRMHLCASNLPTEENDIRAFSAQKATLKIGTQNFSIYKGLRGTRCSWGITH